MGNDIKTSIVVDLKGNLDRQLKRNEKNIARFTKNSSRNLKGLSRSTKVMNGTFTSMGKKLAGLAAAAASIRSISKVIDFDAKMTRMQTDSRVTAKQIAILKKELISLANDPSVRLDKSSILSGFDKVIAMTGDFPNAIKNMRNLALFIQATGTEGEHAGTMIGISFKNGVTEATKVMENLEIQYKQSLTGAVPIRELAVTGKGLISPVTSAVGSRPEVITDTTAVAQITVDAVKNADIVTSSMKAFVSALTKKDVQEKFRNAGVEFKDSKTGKIRLLSQLVPEIYNVTKGDIGTLGKLFGEEGVNVFRGFSKPGGAARLRELAAMKGDGSLIRRDARINASTAKAATQSISNKTSEVLDTVISTPTKDFANAMDNFQATDAWTNAKAIDHALGSVVKRFTVDIFNDLAELTVGNGIRGVKGLFNGNGEQPEAKVILEIESKNATVKTKEIKTKNLQVDVSSGLNVGGVK